MIDCKYKERCITKSWSDGEYFCHHCLENKNNDKAIFSFLQKSLREKDEAK